MNRSLSDAANLGQSGPGSNGNEAVLNIPQSFRTGVPPSDHLVSYQGHYLGWGSYPSAEMHLVYSKVPANWLSSSV